MLNDTCCTNDLLVNDSYIIQGGNKLEGEVKIQGAKNSALPILCACILGTGNIVLKNCPDILDVRYTINILNYMGCKITRENESLIIDNSNVRMNDIPQELMSLMRSSIIFLGALLSKFKKATVYYPGGCDLGARPIDLHLDAFKKMGATIKEIGGNIECNCDNLKGSTIYLSFPSVGATENILLGAVLASGTTKILNAAQEPEIVDLANFLNKRGAKILGAGTSQIIIQGVNELFGAEYSIMPDRIVAATYMCCTAVTRGNVTLKNIRRNDLINLLPVFSQAGCDITFTNNDLHFKCPNKLLPINKITTLPHPGFPTDAQAIIMAMSCFCDYTTIFEENIFENRFRHVPYLNKMGANIIISGKAAIVYGRKPLNGCSVECTDLRGGAAMVVCALGANGETTITNIKHINRGYEHFCENLIALNANISYSSSEV